MAWHGMAWRARAVALLAPSRFLTLCFLPSSRSLSSSVSFCVYMCICLRVCCMCCLSFAFSTSTALDRPPGPLLRRGREGEREGVKIEPLWRASDSPYVATSRIDHPSQSMLTTSGSVWLRSVILKFAQLCWKE